MDPVSQAERAVQSLKSHTVLDVGRSAWLYQHQTLSRLNAQSHTSAQANSEDFVLSFFLTYDKLGTLVNELLVVEAWRENVFPRLFAHLSSLGSEERGSLRAYFCLHHEEVLVNLLEVFLYHDYAAEAFGDLLVDLIDYCVRRVTHLVSLTHLRGREERGGGALESETGSSSFSVLPAHVWSSTSRTASATKESSDVASQLCRWRGSTIFRVGVTCVSLLRYLSDHLSKLPLAAAARILDLHDVPLLCVPLIENPPWVRHVRPPVGDISSSSSSGGGGGWQKYVALEWRPCPPSDLLQLTPYEGQPWLTLHALLMEPASRNRYALTALRRSTLLRVRKFINGVLTDQLPPLLDLQRLFDEISIAPPPETGSGLEQGGRMLMQTVAEVAQRVMREALRAPIGWVKKSQVSATATAAPQTKSSPFLLKGGDDGEAGRHAGGGLTSTLLKLPPTRAQLDEAQREDWTWDDAAEWCGTASCGAFRRRRGRKLRSQEGTTGKEKAEKGASARLCGTGALDLNTWPASDDDEDLVALGNAFASTDIDDLGGGGAALGEPICAKCGALATKRCSRCKNEWYCSREHQLECWEGHKVVCDIVAGDKK